MLVQVDKDSLAASLRKMIKDNSTLLHNQGLILIADDHGLTLTSYHASMRISYLISSEQASVRVKEKGSILIPGSIFEQLIRKLPSGEITLHVSENFMMAVTTKHSRVRLSGIQPAYDPYRTQRQEQFLHLTLNNHLLSSLIGQVSSSISSIENKPVLTCISLEILNRVFRLTATDGVRMARTHILLDTLHDGEPIQVNIPGKNLIFLSKVLPEQGEVTLAIKPNHIEFYSKELYIQSSLIDGVFPSMDRIVPEHFSSVCRVDRLSLLTSLERVCLLSGQEHTVTLEVTNEHTAELKSHSEGVGDVTEYITIHSLQGLPVPLSVNGKYLLEIVKSMPRGEITLQWTDPMTPIVITPLPNQGCNSTYVLGQIRTRTVNPIVR